MTPSRLFAPPPPRITLPWLAMAGLVIAAVLGSMLMSHFIDALHLQMARGEALRVTQRMAGVPDFAAGKNMRVAQLHLPRSNP